MTDSRRLLWLGFGVILGAIGVTLYLTGIRTAQAGSTDRFEDYVIATGQVGTRPGDLRDGVWLLDYRTGRLLATLVDRDRGKITGWAEADLLAEFGMNARQNAHFIMTTGIVSYSQAALYVAETTTGKFGVYTMGPRADGQPGVAIRRHDIVAFREQPRGNN